MNYIDVVNFGIALVGAVLGVIATLHQLNQSRVKLRVVPRLAFMVAPGKVISGTIQNPQMQRLLETCPRHWSVEVVNLSTFPVTLAEVGFGSRRGRRHVIINPIITGDKALPLRLESRDAVTIHAASDSQFDADVLKHAKAFAVTECGAQRYGTSPIFSDFVRRLRQSRTEGDGGR